MGFLPVSQAKAEVLIPDWQCSLILVQPVSQAKAELQMQFYPGCGRPFAHAAMDLFKTALSLFRLVSFMQRVEVYIPACPFMCATRFCLSVSIH